jgi:hypothetical protein
MDKTQGYIKSTASTSERNKNIYAIQAQKPSDINPKWKGCYAGGKGLIYQEDMGNTATVSACKTRASDLGYSNFALTNTTNGQSKCYVGNTQEDTFATKPVVSYSFSMNKNANMGGLLNNGQIGTYKDNISTNLITDLQALEGCDSQVGGLINTKNTVASYGANCTNAKTPTPPQLPTPIPPPPTPPPPSPAPPTPPQPKLKIKTTNEWEKIGTDYRTGGNPDASFWRGKNIIDGGDTYYPLGHSIYAGNRKQVYNNPPSMEALMVSGDVKDPVSYSSVGKSGGYYSISGSTPVCPDGYTSLGDVFSSSLSADTKTPKDIKCVPKECVEENKSKKSRNVWAGLGKSHYVLYDAPNEKATDANAYNLFKMNQEGPFYKIKDTCIQK